MVYPCLVSCHFYAIPIIGRAGASPPSRTAAIIFLYIYLFIYLYIYIYPYVRRALNLLRTSFSPIFQYFSAVNVTPVSFSPIFQYFLTCMPWRHGARGGTTAPAHAPCGPSFNCMFYIPRLLYVSRETLMHT